MPKRHGLGLALLFLLTSAASSVAAQGCPRAAATLPPFDALRLPEAAMGKEALRTALAAASRDDTPGGLWRRANMELALARQGEPAARDSAIRHLAMIIQAASSNSVAPNTPMPEMPHVLYRLGTSLAVRGDVQQARQVFHRLIRHHPQSPLVAASYLHFAEHYVREGDGPVALRFIERAEASTESIALRHYTRYLRVLAGESAPLGEVQAAFLNERSAQGRVYAEHIRRHCR